MAFIGSSTRVSALTLLYAIGSLFVGSSSALPNNTVTINPLSYNVYGSNAVFRNNTFANLFNPTNTTAPFFQVFDPSFLTVLGDSPSFRVIASNPGFAFAHEAPIWVPSTQELFFASAAGSPSGFSDINHNNQVAKISLNDVTTAIAQSSNATAPVNVTVTTLDLPDTVQMTNAGTGPYNGSLLLVNSGRGPLPPNLVLVDPANPQNATVILDNFFGRQFNSLHNAKIHPTSGNIFFTDVAYGWLNHFRPLPLLPNQLYRFDPNSGSVRAVADGFVLPNGLAFSQDGSTVFVSDSGMAGGFIGNNQTGPATIYAFDVDPQTESFGNKRVFSYIDGGVPHGLQLDTAGNLYAGTGDGVEVWNSQGTLIGKFFLGSSSSEMLFIGNGRLIILAETKIYMVSLAAEGLDVDYPQGSSSVSEDPSGC